MENVDRSIDSVQELGAPIVDSEQVVLQFSDTVYRLALVRCKNRTDADDVFQNVFYRYLKYKPSFESQRHQRAWFVRTTINCSNSLLANVWRKRTTELDKNLPAEDTIDLTVYDAVLRLPQKQKTAIHLYYYEGYTVAEIAKIMASPQGTVKSWLSRARAALEKELKGEF
ncbi:MAG: sigma-70 family RNA polymerase sigma factor [Christensenellaceae bacterium]|nr:sigma-70 family RNA polymerase sigma factor [Christensenellaceae bacterium]